MKVSVFAVFITCFSVFCSMAEETIRGDDIISLVESWSEENGENLTVEINSRRLYPNCSTSLKVEPRYSGDFNTLKVTCDDPENPWKINVRAQKNLSVRDISSNKDTIIVASTSIPRGKIIQIDDLTTQTGLKGTAGQHFANVEDVIGSRTRRPINAGQVVKPQYLERIWLIEKDQTVILVTQSHRIKVEALGKALEDGNIGDRIRVENIKSGDKLLGLVKSRKKIEIIAKIK